jgi:hypothetical protein
LNRSESVFHKSFILRITKEKWYRQVFTIKKYYLGVPRRWEAGGTILLARKAEKGDSFIGYGVLERFVKRDLLPEETREKCKKMGWKGELTFSELYELEPPLPIKETILSGSRAKGRYLHGYPLTQEEVTSILNTAKEKCAFRKID